MDSLRFLRAAQRGYFESGINAFSILMRGTSCGSIPKSYNGARLCLMKLRKMKAPVDLEKLQARLDKMASSK